MLDGRHGHYLSLLFCRFMPLLFIIFVSFFENIVNQSQIASTAHRIAGGMTLLRMPSRVSRHGVIGKSSILIAADSGLRLETDLITISTSLWRSLPIAKRHRGEAL